jgi:hypothetical protein
MSKLPKFCFLFVALMLIASGVAMADDQDQKRDRKRDGSCDPEVYLRGTGSLFIVLN